jgi:formate C-acetyltransferase
MRNLKQLAQRAQRVGENRNPSRRRLLLLRGFRENEDEKVHNLRRAKAIAHVLDHYPVEIDPEDLLVGKLTTEPLTAGEGRELRAGEPYLRELQRGLRFDPGSGGVGGHRTVDFEKFLRLGVDGLLREVEDRAAAIDYSRPEDVRRSAFYEACRITLTALLRFAQRYRRRLLELRDAETDPERATRWARLADIFLRIPDQPPRDFQEALQAVWLLQVALSFDDVSCTGHPDRYLWPYYERGVLDGTLSRERALTLVEDLYLRSNEVFGDWPETVMVGGTDRDGNPVLNELTYLFIEAIETVGLVNPNVALCYREDTPDDLLELCLDKMAKGLSHPALYNDRVITEGLVAVGVSLPDARHYQNSTCVEITPVGTSNLQPAALELFPLKVLECMLNNGRPLLADGDDSRFALGRERLVRWAKPLAAGGFAVELDTLTSFADFHHTYRRLLVRAIRDWVVPVLEQAYRCARYGSCPLVSCFVADCIERGMDVAAGGARYNHWGSIAAGFATTVDSLAAIRHAVYEQGHISLIQLRDALAADFAGQEPLRQYLVTQPPKYGNDHPAADALAVDLYNLLRSELARYRTCLGGGFLLGLFSGWGGRLEGRRVSFHVSSGHATAATADGRRARMPLSENIGPAPGADLAGLTAMVNSVTKTDHRHGLGGISVNWRLSPALLTGNANRAKLLALIREFMRKGGFELQINVVSSDTLREAQRHPERYRSLAVRIAGYSEYFCNVGEAQQNAIIARTEYEECGKPCVSP